MPKSAAKEAYEKAYANLGGVGFACFATHGEQERAFQEAFKRLALASRPYILELEAAMAAR